MRVYCYNHDIEFLHFFLYRFDEICKLGDALEYKLCRVCKKLSFFALLKKSFFFEIVGINDLPPVFLLLKLSEIYILGQPSR